MDAKRVVVTGMGVISCVGQDVDTFWKNLVSGYCGIDYVEEFKDMPVTFAGKVKGFDAEKYGMDKPFIRKQDNFTLYAMAAAWQAMKQSGLEADVNIDSYKLGVYVGSGIGGFDVQFRETAKMVEDPSGKWISPLFIATMISNIAAGHIAIKHQAKGPCLDIVTACATASHCIGEAFRAVRHGYADAIIAGGSEHASIPLGVAGFYNAKALTRASDPKYSSLPFNANRQGFVMGDGAAVIILESLDHGLGHSTTMGAQCQLHLVVLQCQVLGGAVQRGVEEGGAVLAYRIHQLLLLLLGLLALLGLLLFGFRLGLLLLLGLDLFF